MSDLTRQTRPGKRERLVTSAAQLVHRQGIDRTTLAQVAEAADVPLGNVYYYFKTREDLLRAVVEARAKEVRDLLSSLDARATPQARLRGLTQNWTSAAEEVAAFGCPIGGLTSELTKQDGDLSDDSPRLLREIVDWAAKQYRELGYRDAASRAESLVAHVQGAALLTRAFRDPHLLKREVRRVGRDIPGPVGQP